MKKYLLRTVVTAILLCLMLCGEAWAGEWHSEKGYWEYAENGSNVTNQWRTIDGVDYLFDGSGKLLGDNGYSVDCPPGLLPNTWAETKTQALMYNGYWNQALDLINQTRIANGVQPLTLDYDLCIAATYRCIEAVANLNFTHYINGVRRVDAILGPETGNRQRVGKGENMDSIHSTGSCRTYDMGKRLPEMDQDLKTSQGHFENIVRAEFTKCGIGLAISEGSDGKLHSEYVQIFN